MTKNIKHVTRTESLSSLVNAFNAESTRVNAEKLLTFVSAKNLQSYDVLSDDVNKAINQADSILLG